jgi:hypothetical protein
VTGVELATADGGAAVGWPSNLDIIDAQASLGEGLYTNDEVIAIRDTTFVGDDVFGDTAILDAEFETATELTIGLKFERRSMLSGF